MSIDFHSDDNRGTYASRDADITWAASMQSIVAPAGRRVADIGCGGGIYARAWKEMGVAWVAGVDFSAQMVSDAQAASASYTDLSFIQSDATHTGLPDKGFDIVFSRAVVHHLLNIPNAIADPSPWLCLRGVPATARY